MVYPPRCTGTRNGLPRRDMELIPALDLLGGRVVRLVQGDYSRVTSYGDDPLEWADRWVGEGAARLHLVDLDGARSGSGVQADLIARIVARAGVPCQVAGGIRDGSAVTRMLDAGADRVVLGSALIRDPTLASVLVARHGPDSIVAAVDVRDGRALGSGWLPGAVGADALWLAGRLASEGVRWLAVTAIDRDGLLGGPDMDLLRRVREAAPQAAVIASAGVSDVTHVAALAAGGFAGAILGRALYEGRLSLADALRAAG